MFIFVSHCFPLSTLFWLYFSQIKACIRKSASVFYLLRYFPWSWSHGLRQNKIFFR